MPPEESQPGFVSPPPIPAQGRSPIRSVIGIDGCRGGWVIAEAPSHAPHPVAVRVIRTLADDQHLLAALRLGAFAAIDMPIGLPSATRPATRACDAAARNLLGPRGSSVFGVPCREAVNQTDYREALQANRRVMGVGISKQAHNICNKIAELDSWLLSLGPAGERVIETHPELTVGRLAKGTGVEQIHRKKDAAGHRQRVTLLEAEGVSGVESLVSRVLSAPHADGIGLAADDAIDALLCLLVAQRAARGEANTLPDGESPQRDERGRAMQIWF